MRYPNDSQQDEFRIITMGDSFTFGQYVNTEDNYPQQLSDRLKKYPCIPVLHSSVINLGELGYDIAYAVEKYRLKGQDYNPSLLIWLINPHNIEHVNELLTSEAERLLRDMSKKDLEEASKSGDYYYVWNTASKNIEEAYGKEKILDYQKTQFQKLFSLYKGPLVIIIWRDGPDTYSQFIESQMAMRPMTYVMRTLFWQDIQSEGGFLKDGHPNKIGYQLISEKIYDFLLQNGLLSCDR